MLRRMSRPRVLMTCDAIGGIWRYAVDLARALERRGMDTVLVGTGPAPRVGSSNALSRRPLWLDIPPTWMAPGAEAVERLVKELGRLQREYGADIVHMNQPAEAAFLDVEVPVVLAAHSCLTTWWRAVRDGQPPADWIWRTELEAIGYRRADMVVAPTQSHAAVVRDAYGIALPLLVPNASDVPAGDTVRDPVVVAAGRWWDAGKNLAVLDAAATATRWPVLIFGSLEGPDGSRVAVQNVRPLGQRPASEVHATMRRAAVFVSPSLYEPFGLAALEAARSGAALVLADIPTYRETWNGAARFFHPRSAAGLASALEAVTGNDGTRRNLAVAASARAAAFSFEAQGSAIMRAYAAAGLMAAPGDARQAVG